MTDSTETNSDTVGLTHDDVNLMQTLWYKLLQNPGESGAEIFKIVFKHNPEYRQLFPFNDVPDEEWHLNEKFLNHVNTSYKGFSLLLDTIEDPDTLKLNMSKIIQSHKKRNLTETHFIHLRDAVIGISPIFFDQKEERQTWKKAMDMIFDLIVKKFREKSDE